MENICCLDQTSGIKKPHIRKKKKILWLIAYTAIGVNFLFINCNSEVCGLTCTLFKKY